MAPVADNYLIGYSVCVKCLHETNVQTSWSSESGNKCFIYFTRFGNFSSNFYEVGVSLNIYLFDKQTGIRKEACWTYPNLFQVGVVDRGLTKFQDWGFLYARKPCL